MIFLSIELKVLNHIKKRVISNIIILLSNFVLMVLEKPKSSSSEHISKYTSYFKKKTLVGLQGS